MYFCDRIIVKLMFLREIKKKSVEKYISKTLLKARNLNSSKIKTLGVLLDATIYSQFPYADVMSNLFEIPQENIVILYYHPDKKQKETFKGNLYTDADLSFKANLKNEIANQFIETSFDCLLNFYTEDKLLLNLVAVKSKAKFKIGFASINENINDFSVATDINNIAEFTFELKKYLTILNKI